MVLIHITELFRNFRNTVFCSGQEFRRLIQFQTVDIEFRVDSGSLEKDPAQLIAA